MGLDMSLAFCLWFFFLANRNERRVKNVKSVKSVKKVKLSLALGGNSRCSESMTVNDAWGQAGG
jgi:hypothetical protein